MFSYRHAFHAGNHADVLKHTTLIALMKYLTQKDTALTVIDTHAGAGLYRLDGDYTETSGEALEGILKLLAKPLAEAPKPGSKAKPVVVEPLAPALQDYLDVLKSLNPQFAQSDEAAHLRIYPGSPFIEQRFLSGRDKLKPASAELWSSPSHDHVRGPGYYQ
jgi:23S rRNA (adenine2030-N6)-methyltransferase